MTRNRPRPSQLHRLRSHPALALLFALALAVNLAIPPGLMPSTEGGRPTVILCPDDGRSARLLEALGAQSPHHDHHAHSDSPQAATPLCELALLAGFEFIAPDSEWLDPARLRSVHSTPELHASPLFPFPRNGRSRAPPGRSATA